MRRILMISGTLWLGTLNPAVSGQSDELAFRGSFTWLTSASVAELRDAPLNPGNTVVRLPDWSLRSDLRPNLKLANGTIQFVLRPRVRWTFGSTEVSGHDANSSGKSESFLNEAFFQWMISDKIFFVYGLQTFQWGPTEILSPSNRLFHESALARNVLYESSGKYMARLNYSPTANTSLVLMTEYEENKNESAFLADKEFETATLLKGEYSWDGGVSYIGAVVGGREHGRPWVGEYVNILIPGLEGLSAYADASHQAGSRAYYPSHRTVPSPQEPKDITVLSDSFADSRRIYTLGVAGLRYDFEDGSILRGAYVLNQAGYSDAQKEDLADALTSPDPLQASVRGELIRRALAPGLELPGRRYAYASLHYPDTFTVTDLTLYVRTLFSLTDQSSSSYLALNYAVGNAGTAFLASAVTIGSDTSELAGLTKNSHTLGYEHVW